jgi:hypothetical protein
MSQDLERIHELEISVELLKRDSDQHTKMLEKMQVALERYVDVTDVNNSAIKVHDEKFKNQEKLNEDIKEQLDEHEARTMERLDDLKKDLITHINLVTTAAVDGVEKKESKEDPKIGFFKTIVENWKYLSIGAVVMAAVITHKWGLITALFN